jgi:probable rRNA maturation factor
MMNYEYINQSKESSWRNYKQYVDQIIVKIYEILNLDKEYVFSIILVNPETIQSINAEYRNLDTITDVISFASQDEVVMIDNDTTVELGDIFINIQAIRNQAKEYEHSLKREFCFLVTHGILHLLGYDHINLEDEMKMFKLQEEILYEIARR